MSWMEGVGPVKDISEVGISRGLSEDWYSDTTSVSEIKDSDFWDIMDNPLYQAAAEASGYNWDEWVANAKSKVGHGPGDWVYVEIEPGTSGGVKRVRTGRNSYENVQTPGTPGKWEWMTKEEAEDLDLPYKEGSTKRWRNKDTGEISMRGNPHSPTSSLHEQWDDEWENVRDWGIHDLEIAEDIDVFNKWLDEIVDVNDHLPKIIREGPKGEHYGIEGDIWEYYGLDEEPEPPKELEWDSYDKKMNLKTAVASNVSYSTPEGLEPIDLHAD